MIGLFAVYPPLGRELTSDQSALLGALAGQIAVAVQNARLHEETKLLGSGARAGARRRARGGAAPLALYEISRSFAQSLSLDSTLDAVARTLVELLEVDAAVIRLPDERGESLVAQAVHVSSPQLSRQSMRSSTSPIRSWRARLGGGSPRAGPSGSTRARRRSSAAPTGCSCRSSSAARPRP